MLVSKESPRIPVPLIWQYRTVEHGTCKVTTKSSKLTGEHNQDRTTLEDGKAGRVAMQAGGFRG